MLMRFRRLFALLTSITMLHLTVVAGDAACVTHGVGEHHTAKAGATQAMAMSGHAMPMSERAAAATPSPVPVAKSGTPPCEVPTQQRCCEALVGCSVDSAVSGSADVPAAVVSPATQVHGAPDDAPASFAAAPEPPPPKA